jgi:hypothetical protein
MIIELGSVTEMTQDTVPFGVGDEVDHQRI